MKNYFIKAYLALAAAFVLVGAHVASAVDIDQASVTTSLTGIATSAQTLVNTIVPVALALVAVAILIKYLRKGAK